MKPIIERLRLSGGPEIWSVRIGQFCVFTSCFALACCYAATGEVQRRHPMVRPEYWKGVSDIEETIQGGSTWMSERL